MSVTPTSSSETQAMLDSLRQAVAQTLERKKRLGQYALSGITTPRSRWAMMLPSPCKPKTK